MLRPEASGARACESASAEGGAMPRSVTLNLPPRPTSQSARACVDTIQHAEQSTHTMKRAPFALAVVAAAVLAAPRPALADLKSADAKLLHGDYAAAIKDYR